VAEAVAMVEAEGVTAEEAAERVGLGGNTVRRALRDPTRASPAPPAAVPRAPATANDRKVDELVSRSRTWERVCEVLAAFAQRHPEIAQELADDLRGLDL
jgi:transposase